MRYDDPGTRRALAAEYVLGSLRGRARRRFERLMSQRSEWRDEVDVWSRNLAGFAATVEPVDPPPSLWGKIQARTTRPRVSAAPAVLGWWQALAGVASTIAMVLAIVLLATPPAPAPRVAVLKDQDARAGWMLTIVPKKAGGADMRIVVEGARAVPDRSFELWAVPGTGQPPVSLGLLPAQGEATRPVPAMAAGLLQPGAALAVSIEPPGGSPTGQPTGAIAYQGKLTAM